MPAVLPDRDLESGLDVSEDFVPTRVNKEASTTSIDFDGLLTPALSLHEDLANGNGGQAWPAGMILARYLLRRKREDLHNTSMSVCRNTAVCISHVVASS